MSFYAIGVGRRVGIVLNWADCQKEVLNFPGAKYKKHKTFDDAIAFVKYHNPGAQFSDGLDNRLYDPSELSSPTMISSPPIHSTPTTSPSTIQTTQTTQTTQTRPMPPQTPSSSTPSPQSTPTPTPQTTTLPRFETFDGKGIQKEAFVDQNQTRVRDRNYLISDDECAPPLSIWSFENPRSNKLLLNRLTSTTTYLAAIDEICQKAVSDGVKDCKRGGCIIIHTDGGASPNPGPTGSGIFIEIQLTPEKSLYYEYVVKYGLATNQWGELTALEYALQIVPTLIGDVLLRVRRNNKLLKALSDAKKDKEPKIGETTNISQTPFHKRTLDVDPSQWTHIILLSDSKWAMSQFLETFTPQDEKFYTYVDPADFPNRIPTRANTSTKQNNFIFRGAYLQSDANHVAKPVDSSPPDFGFDLLLPTNPKSRKVLHPLFPLIRTRTFPRVYEKLCCLGVNIKSFVPFLVKAHIGCIGNEVADQLSNIGRHMSEDDIELTQTIDERWKQSKMLARGELYSFSTSFHDKGPENVEFVQIVGDESIMMELTQKQSRPHHDKRK